jgi:hypothetical protein
VQDGHGHHQPLHGKFVSGQHLLPIESSLHAAVEIFRIDLDSSEG